MLTQANTTHTHIHLFIECMQVSKRTRHSTLRQTQKKRTFKREREKKDVRSYGRVVNDVCSKLLLYSNWCIFVGNGHTCNWHLTHNDKMQKAKCKTLFFLRFTDRLRGKMGITRNLIQLCQKRDPHSNICIDLI